MGSQLIICCVSTDFFKDLLMKYGQKFIRLIISEKMRYMLETKFDQITQIIKKYVEKFVSQVNQIVDQKISQFTQIFEEIKGNVEQMFPGKINEIQAKNGQSIDQFTGFSDFLFKIDQARDNALLKLQQTYKQIMTNLKDKKNQIRKQIELQRPHVPFYDSLSEKNKNKVFHKAEKQFSDKILQAQNKIGSKCDSNFNQYLQTIEKSFESIDLESFLSLLISRSAKQMMEKFGGGVCARCFNC